MIKVKRVLISVSDKTGLLEFARGLHALGVEIISTGGTARLLKSSHIPAKEVSEYTGFPEILDGRVKTLHPKIHAGLLALRDDSGHLQQLKDHSIGLIDMVVVNLYPFEKTIEKKNVSLEEAIENIDIGGPTMLRAAAKNFKNVAVICQSARYKEILNELNQNSGILSDSVLMNLAIEVFELTSQYDTAIYNFLKRRLKSNEFSSLPKDLTLKFSKQQDLRYGENPHQMAAFYSSVDETGGLPSLEQLHGKELSFNNLLDLNAAVDVIKDFEKPTAVVIKHNNPTGVAQDENLAKAFKQAFNCDPLSAFGGIIGLNRKVDIATATAISKSGFMECVIAPDYDKEALELLSQKKNIRLIRIALDQWMCPHWDFKKVNGGLLLQDPDRKTLSWKDVRVVTKVKPSASQIASLLFGWTVIKNVKSNAIVLVKGFKTVGIGCGQTSRVDSALTAIRKAGKDVKNAALLSEAFIPKIDTVQLAKKAGVKIIMQTGGSIADEDVIKEADRAKICMVMTGLRHFKH